MAREMTAQAMRIVEASPASRVWISARHGNDTNVVDEIGTEVFFLGKT